MDPLNRPPVDPNSPPQQNQNANTAGPFTRACKSVVGFVKNVNTAMLDYLNIQHGFDGEDLSNRKIEKSEVKPEELKLGKAQVESPRAAQPEPQLNEVKEEPPELLQELSEDSELEEVDSGANVQAADTKPQGNENLKKFLDGLNNRNPYQSMMDLAEVMNSDDPAAKEAAEKKLNELLSSDDDKLLELGTEIVCAAFDKKSEIKMPLNALQKMCLGSLLSGLEQRKYSKESIHSIRVSLLRADLPKEVYTQVKDLLLNLTKSNRSAAGYLLKSITRGIRIAGMISKNPTTRVLWLNVLDEMLDGKCINPEDFIQDATDGNPDFEGLGIRSSAQMLSLRLLVGNFLDNKLAVKDIYTNLMVKVSSNADRKREMLEVLKMQDEKLVNRYNRDNQFGYDALFFCLKVAINELSEDTEASLKEIFLDIAEKSQDTSQKKKIDDFLNEIDEIMFAIDGDAGSQEKVLKRLNESASSGDLMLKNRAIITLIAIIEGGHKVSDSFMVEVLDLMKEKFPAFYSSSVIQDYIERFSKSSAGGKSVRSAKR